MKDFSLFRFLFNQLSFHSDEGKEFFAGLVLIECTAEVTGGGDAALFLHASHLHAHVLGLYDHHHSLGMKCLVDSLTDLLGQAFLQLEAMAEYVHHTGDLA